MDWFTAERVSDQLTAIHSRSGEILYLLQGTERALLVDTCVGVRGLREFVTSLTTLPLTVWATHGHVDHAMGAPEFDRVHLNPLDRPVYDEMSSLDVRREYVAMCCPDHPLPGDEDWVPPEPVHFVDLPDATVFDGGGCSAEAIHFPGHTPGMTAVLFREERVLLTGDGCNPRTFLFDHNASTVADYREAVLTLQARVAGRFDHVFTSHVVREVPAGILAEAVATCDEVLAGGGDAVPFDFLGQRALLAKAIDESGARLDGGCFNLVYDPSRLGD